MRPCNNRRRKKEYDRLAANMEQMQLRLERLGRSVAQASALITTLIDAGITVNVLNVGVLSNDSVSCIMV